MSDLSLALTIKVVDEASAQLKKLNTDFNKISDNWEKLGFAMGASLKVGLTAAIGSIAALTKQAIDNADEMGKLAQKAGVTVEAFSALAYAAELSDVSNEQLKTGLKGLNESLVDSQDSASNSAAAFKYLNIETKNADGSLRKADAVFQDIAEKFSKMEDGASKSALAVDLMKKSGVDLIPVLNEGKDGLREMADEAERLGLIISKDQAEAAEQFNDSMTRIGNAAAGVGMGISQELLPTLNALTVEILDIIKTSPDFKRFAEVVGASFKFIVKAGGFVVAFFNILGKSIGGIVAAAVRAMSGDFTGARQILRDMNQDVNDVKNNYNDFTAAIDAGVPVIKKSTDETGKKTKALKDYARATSDAAKEEIKRNKLFADLTVDIARQTEGVRTLTTVNQILWEMESGRYASLTSKQKTAIANQLIELELAERKRILEQTQIQTVVDAQGAVNALGTENLKLASYFANVIAKGTKQADVLMLVEAQASALDEQITALNITLAQTKLTTPGDEKAIRDLELRIQGMVAAKKFLEDNKVSAEYESAAKTQSDITFKLSTWKKYIGDARDAAKQLNDEEEFLWVLLQKNLLSTEEFSLAMKTIDTSKLELAKSKLTDLEKKMVDVANEIQGTFSSFFYDAMQGQFTNIFDSFKKMLDKMVAEALAAKLANALFGDLTKNAGVSGSGGDLISGLFKFFGFRESGGDVTAGQPYIVGEKRAEVFIPKTNGTIVPSLQEAGGMMSSNNNIQLSVTAMDSQDVIRALDKIKRPLTEMIQGTSRTYNMG